MKNYKKTFWGSMIAFFIGTSCCWLSTLAIWLGGAVFIGTLSSWIEDVQILIIVLAIVLLITTFYFYIKKSRQQVHLKENGPQN